MEPRFAPIVSSLFLVSALAAVSWQDGRLLCSYWLMCFCSCWLTLPPVWWKVDVQ